MLEAYPFLVLTGAEAENIIDLFMVMYSMLWFQQEIFLLFYYLHCRILYFLLYLLISHYILKGSTLSLLWQEIIFLKSHFLPKPTDVLSYLLNVIFYDK